MASGHLLVVQMSKVLLQNQSRELRVLVSAWATQLGLKRRGQRDLNRMGKAECELQSWADWKLQLEPTSYNNRVPGTFCVSDLNVPCHRNYLGLQ